MAEDTHLLFVCSRNQWRSPTGERIWYRHKGIQARSAGTSRGARRRVRLEDIQWADVIFVMEQKHKSRLAAEFRQELNHKKIHVLEIPDNYQFMDQELVELLWSGTEDIVRALVAD